MYPVSSECLKAFSNYKRDLRFRITADNVEINEADVMEFEINEGLMQSENFELGGCVATTFSVKINNLHGLYSAEKFKGKEIRVAIGIITTNSTEFVPMGVFTVDEVTDDKSFIKIETLNSMIKFEKDYESKLQYPTTAKAMLQEMCSLCGVTLATNSFSNENYIINKPIEQERCRNILHDIAILAGGFAKINRNGKLELKTITNSNIEINKDNYIDLNVKEKFYIDKFVVTETYFPIDAIPFNLEVIPFTSKWNGNPALDVGDTIKLNDDKSTVKSIVTKQKIKFSGGLTYESECSGLSEQQQQTQLVNQKKVNRRFASEIKQNADEISTKVTADEACSAVVQNADKLKISIDGKLKGKTYTFDGDGFHLGGTDSQDVATHTNSYSEWKYSDGSKTRIDRNGFYYQNGSSRNEYHHLQYFASGELITESGGFFGVNIKIPDEFKNKTITAIPLFSEIKPNGRMGFCHNQGITATVNYANMTVRVSGVAVYEKVGWKTLEDGATVYTTYEDKEYGKTAKITYGLILIA